MPNLVRIHLVSLAVGHLFVLSLSRMRVDSHSPFRGGASIHVHLFTAVLLQPLKFTSGVAFRGRGGIRRVDGGTGVLPTWGVTSRGGGGGPIGPWHCVQRRATRGDRWHGRDDRQNALC